MSIVRLGELRAKPGAVNALLEFIGRVIVPGVTLAAGNLGCQVLQHSSDQHRFFIIETWDSVGSHAASVKNISREEIAAIMPLLDDSPQGGYYHELAFSNSARAL